MIREMPQVEHGNIYNNLIFVELVLKKKLKNTNWWTVMIILKMEPSQRFYGQWVAVVLEVVKWTFFFIQSNYALK